MPVTVIGLGNMGAAFAQRFTSQGMSTCIWTRSPARLSRVSSLCPQAIVHKNASDGFSASPDSLVVTALPTFAATREFLSSHEPYLKGSTVLNLCSGPPSDAQDLDAYLATQDVGLYIDGAYAGAPAAAAAGTGMLLLGSSKPIPANIDLILQSLATTVRHFGPVGRNRVVDFCVVDCFLNAAATFFADTHALAACGVRPSEVVDLVTARLSSMGPALTAGAARIEKAEDMRGHPIGVVTERAAIEKPIDAGSNERHLERSPLSPSDCEIVYGSNVGASVSVCKHWFGCRQDWMAAEHVGGRRTVDFAASLWEDVERQYGPEKDFSVIYEFLRSAKGSST